MLRRRTAIATIVAAAGLMACGSQGIELDARDRDDPRMRQGAELFAQRCSGCHTLDAVGAEGSSISIADQERVDGPNFNVRRETRAQVLYAIRNGGFSGAIMPQNIVVGRDADDVALFLSRYAGRKATAPQAPGARDQPSGGQLPEIEQAPGEVQGGREPDVRPR